MKPKAIIILIYFYFAGHFCFGQVKSLDSCGLDSTGVLNRYEAIVLDSLNFRPFKTRKNRYIDSIVKFEYKDKKVAFYACNSITGMITKKEFFDICKRKFIGYPGKGVIIFNEKEKQESNGFDALVFIGCPYDLEKIDKFIFMINKRNN